MSNVNQVKVPCVSLNERPAQTFTSGFRNLQWTYSGVKTLWKLSELCQGVAQQHVRMGAVEQNTDDGLRRAGIVDDLERHGAQALRSDS